VSTAAEPPPGRQVCKRASYGGRGGPTHSDGQD